MKTHTLTDGTTVRLPSLTPREKSVARLGYPWTVEAAERDLGKALALVGAHADTIVAASTKRLAMALLAARPGESFGIA